MGIVEIYNVFTQLLEIFHSFWLPFCFPTISATLNLAITVLNINVGIVVIKYDQILRVKASKIFLGIFSLLLIQNFHTFGHNFVFGSHSE